MTRNISLELMEGIRNSSSTMPGPSKSPGSAKNILQFFDLFKEAFDNYLTLTGEVNKINLSWEFISSLPTPELITFNVIDRKPGVFSRASLHDQGDVRNAKPLFRESTIDKENNGYRTDYYGYLHDNTVQFICWAETQHEAMKRALWLEEFINKYQWYFISQGTQRVIFLSGEAVRFTESQGKKMYGQSLNFLVRTETITTISEKQLEEIVVSLSLNSGG